MPICGVVGSLLRLALPEGWQRAALSRGSYTVPFGRKHLRNPLVGAHAIHY